MHLTIVYKSVSSLLHQLPVMACYKVVLFVSLYCLYLPVTSTKLTTLLRDKNLTSLEERLTYLEQTIERRLNVTEVLLGQLLTGRNGANLETLNVVSLRSSECTSTIVYGSQIIHKKLNKLTFKSSFSKDLVPNCILVKQMYLLINKTQLIIC